MCKYTSVHLGVDYKLKVLVDKCWYIAIVAPPACGVLLHLYRRDVMILFFATHTIIFETESKFSTIAGCMGRKQHITFFYYKAYVYFLCT